MIETIERIEKSGADFASITESIDTSSAMGRFFFHIIAAMAELERGLISERTKAGIDAMKRKNPDKKWGTLHSITDHPKRLAAIQKLYDDDVFALKDRAAGGVDIATKPIRLAI